MSHQHQLRKEQGSSMEGANNQTVNQMPPPVVSVPSAPIPAVPVSGGGGSNKSLLILIIVGVVILLILGLGIFFYMSSSPSTSLTTDSVPVSETSGEEEVVQADNSIASSVTEVKGASDLDQLITELSQVDGTLEKELSTLEKDSDF